MSILRRVFFTSGVRFKSNWIQPEGYDTGIKIYNCITKSKVPLIIANKSCMTWYTCGPTVYDSAHIGHASCYVKLDIIQRILRDYFKLNLVTVMNITDIDDKIINESKAHNKSPIEVARYYEKEYIQDLDRLGVSKPNMLVRVTDNMSIIVKYIKKLVDDNKAYKTEDGSVYFDVGQYKNYGKLQNIGEGSTEEVNPLKKSPMDFALWKAAKSNEPYWDSSFGPGRPGWHIECSALAGNIIGSTIDIHAGGIDLRFPHHENEEAQSCAYHSKTQWVNYWLHTGHLHLKDSIKMSKSLKNTISIQEMLQTTSATIFRTACLMSHYRYNMEYSENLIIGAMKLLETIKNFVDDCNAYLKGHIQSNIDVLLLDTLEKTMTDVKTALEDDFDTAATIKSVQSLMSMTNKMLHTPPAGPGNHINHSVIIIAILNYVVQIFNACGVNLEEAKTENLNENDKDIVDILIRFRQNIRQLSIADKHEEALKLCDEVRDELRNAGIYVKDHGKVSSWSR